MIASKLSTNRFTSNLVHTSFTHFYALFLLFARSFSSEFGTISPEASYIGIFGFTGGFIGAMYGGLMQSRFAELRFRESNEATVFDSKVAAQRKLLDSMTLSFGKGAVRYGIRYALFFSSFS